MKPDIKEILDNCIKAIESGEKTVEECLHIYKDRRSELEPMLTAATKLVNAGKVLPFPARKQEIRDKLVAAADEKHWEEGLEREAIKKAPAGIMRLRTTLVRISLITAVFVLIGGTTLAMAKESLPGSPFYPVKLALEKAKFELARDDDTRKRLYVSAAEERLSELKRIESDSEYYQDLVLSIAEKIEMADATLDNEEYEEEFNELIRKNKDVLEGVLEKAPEKAKPAILNALKNISTDNQSERRTDAQKNNEQENGKDSGVVNKESRPGGIAKPSQGNNGGSSGEGARKPGNDKIPNNIETPKPQNNTPLKQFNSNDFGSRGPIKGRE